MEKWLQKIFDSVPADDPRSRLEPYCELILRWHRQGRTYHRIRQLLAEQCDITVAYVTLYRFIQRRSRPKTAPPPEAQLAIIMPVVAGGDISPEIFAPITRGNRSHERGGTHFESQAPCSHVKNPKNCSCMTRTNH